MTSDYCPKISNILIENLRLRAYIGFMDWEKEKLQDVVISFSFKYDIAKVCVTDNVQDAVNYKTITKGIIKMVDGQRFNLIEALAEKVYQYILQTHPDIQDVLVTIEKPKALRFTDNVMVRIDGKERYNIAMISLGSNIDAEMNFEKALYQLQSYGKIVQQSEFVYTEPLKYTNQAKFLNGAILFCTHDNLSTLKLNLKQIEAMIGRVRTENKNAPRKIDLDVITFNEMVIDKEIYEMPFLIDFLKVLQPQVEI